MEHNLTLHNRLKISKPDCISSLHGKRSHTASINLIQEQVFSMLMFECRTVLIIGIFCYTSDIDVSYNFNSHTAHYVHRVIPSHGRCWLHITQNNGKIILKYLSMCKYIMKSMIFFLVYLYMFYINSL